MKKSLRSLLNFFYRKSFSLVWMIFASWVPSKFNFVHVSVLKVFGARVSWKSVIYGSVRIREPRKLKLGIGSCLGPRVFIYNVANIEIGDNTIISQDTELCTASHDFRSSSFELIDNPIIVGSNVWIAAKSLILPGVTIGSFSLVGAGSVVRRDIDSAVIVTGNPAEKVGDKCRTPYSF